MNFTITIKGQTVSMTLSQLKALVRARKAEGAVFIQNHKRDINGFGCQTPNWYIESPNKEYTFNCFVRLSA